MSENRCTVIYFSELYKIFSEVKSHFTTDFV